MKRIIKTEAFVLRKRTLSNADKIITLFTEDVGKIHVFAKGIKKIVSRRLPHVQTSNFIAVLLYRKNDFFYLQETSLLSGFSEIKKTPQKIEILYSFLFILDRLLPENQKEIDVYNLTKQFLIQLSHTIERDNRIVTFYVNKLLVLLGYSKEEKQYKELQTIVENLIGEKMPAALYV